MKSSIHIGTAAWNIPKAYAELFPREGSQLVRYSQTLNCVEINTSFYREHQAKTYARWAQETPENFRFSVKLSKVFTHEQELNFERNQLKESVLAIQNLGNKLGALLIQTAPSLEFNPKVAGRFFKELRKLSEGALVVEPRHPSWTTNRAVDLLVTNQVSSVIADPEKIKFSPDRFNDAVSAGNLVYYRYHGSPSIYKSEYDGETLAQLAKEMTHWSQTTKQVWCIFDNTTFGHATKNAVDLKEKAPTSRRR